MLIEKHTSKSIVTSWISVQFSSNRSTKSVFNIQQLNVAGVLKFDCSAWSMHASWEICTSHCDDLKLVCRIGPTEKMCLMKTCDSNAVIRSIILSQIWNWMKTWEAVIRTPNDHWLQSFPPPAQKYLHRIVCTSYSSYSCRCKLGLTDGGRGKICWSDKQPRVHVIM